MDNKFVFDPFLFKKIKKKNITIDEFIYYPIDNKDFLNELFNIYDIDSYIEWVENDIIKSNVLIYSIYLISTIARIFYLEYLDDIQKNKIRYSHNMEKLLAYFKHKISKETIIKIIDSNELLNEIQSKNIFHLIVNLAKKYN